MDKKIAKYKLKKNKLEEEIIDILNLKKEYYENEIINSNDNTIITDGVENFFNNFKYKQNEHLIIIVSGLYSVGKTTFISHLENYIQMVNKSSLKKKENQNQINLIQKFVISNDIDFINNLEFYGKITIIECCTTIVDKINLQIDNLTLDLQIININIIPKNATILKNKIINKIILDISNKSNYFVEFIKNNDIFETDEINLILNNLNLLKEKNDIFFDEDFIFLDKIINIYYLNINDLSTNINLPSNTQKYYL